MLTNLIYASIAFVLSIILFLRYNNGMGAALNSLSKRSLYFFSVVCFIGGIIFISKAYYFSDNQKYMRIITEINRQQDKYERIINVDYELANKSIQKSLLELGVYIDQLNCDSTIRTDSLQVMKELKTKFLYHGKLTTSNLDSLIQKVRSKQIQIGELTYELDIVINKENDNYFNILTAILSTFIAFVIAFTFKNKILG